LTVHDHTYEDVATKFLEHFGLIATAINQQGLWDDRDRFYYDSLRTDDGQRTVLRARSLVGLIPLIAVTVVDQAALARLSAFRDRLEKGVRRNRDLAGAVSQLGPAGDGGGRLLSVVDPDRLRLILSKMLDEREFLSPYGIRSLSKF